MHSTDSPETDAQACSRRVPSPNNPAGEAAPCRLACYMLRLGFEWLAVAEEMGGSSIEDNPEPRTHDAKCEAL